jgi:trehalose/maltose transport system permease protein
MGQRTAVGARPVPTLQPGRGLTLAQRQARLAWFFLLPSLAIVLLVAMVPLVQTIIYSLTDKRLGSIEATHFIGLKNYRFLFSDGAWWHAVWVTIEFTMITVFFLNSCSVY